MPALLINESCTWDSTDSTKNENCNPFKTILRCWQLTVVCGSHGRFSMTQKLLNVNKLACFTGSHSRAPARQNVTKIENGVIAFSTALLAPFIIKIVPRLRIAIILIHYHAVALDSKYPLAPVNRQRYLVGEWRAMNLSGWVADLQHACFPPVWALFRHAESTA